MTYEEILQVQDPIARFGLLSEFNDVELAAEIERAKELAKSLILKKKGADFKGNYDHTDGRTYQVRTDIKYPNIMTYDEDHKLSAKLLEKESLQSQISSLTVKINGIKDDIVKAHPLQKKDVTKYLVYLRKEAKNERK